MSSDLGTSRTDGRSFAAANGSRWVRPGDVVTIDPADYAYSSGEPLTVRVIKTIPDLDTVLAENADWVRVAGVEVVGGVEKSERRVLVRLSALAMPDDGGAGCLAVVGG